MANICGSLNLLVFIKISSIIKPEKILLLKPIILRGDYRLTTIPGIGVLNATALVAAIGDASSFKRARNLGAWLGLVPRQFTTGGKPRLLGIAKRGKNYFRTLLVHGARAAMPVLSQSDTPVGQWFRALVSRGIQRNVAMVALANKLARIAWAILRKE